MPPNTPMDALTPSNITSWETLLATIPQRYRHKLGIYLERRYNASRILRSCQGAGATNPIHSPAIRTADGFELLQCLSPSRSEWIGLVVDVAEELAAAYGGLVRKTCNCPCYRLVGVPDEVRSDFDAVIDSCDVYTLNAVAIGKLDSPWTPNETARSWAEEVFGILS